MIAVPSLHLGCKETKMSLTSILSNMHGAAGTVVFFLVWQKISLVPGSWKFFNILPSLCFNVPLCYIVQCYIINSLKVWYVEVIQWYFENNLFSSLSWKRIQKGSDRWWTTSPRAHSSRSDMAAGPWWQHNNRRHWWRLWYSRRQDV